LISRMSLSWVTPFWTRKSICASHALELSGHPCENVTTGPLPQSLVVDCRSVFHRNCAHMLFSLSSCEQNYSQSLVLVCRHHHRNAFVLH
jgi:hypothetical protein